MEVNEQLKIIDLLAKHELKLGELYKCYASQLTDFAEFWRQIAREEESHSSWIKSLINGIENKNITIGEHRFSDYEIQTSINTVNGLILSAEDVPINIKKALENAYKYERSLIETDFFRFMDGDSDELKTVLNNLAEATKKHAEEIQVRMEQVG